TSRQILIKPLTILIYRPIPIKRRNTNSPILIKRKIRESVRGKSDRVAQTQVGDQVTGRTNGRRIVMRNMMIEFALLLPMPEASLMGSKGFPACCRRQTVIN